MGLSSQSAASPVISYVPSSLHFPGNLTPIQCPGLDSSFMFLYSLMRRGQESWGCLAWRCEGSEGILSIYIDICKASAQRMEAGFFQCAQRQNQRPWAMGQLKHRRFPLNIRKHFSTVRTSALAQLGQRVCGDCLFGDTEKLSGHSSRQLALHGPA